VSHTIVITGMGIASALGAGKHATRQALLSGADGLGAPNFTPTDLPVLLGEMPMSNATLRDATHCDNPVASRTVLMGLLALDEALAQAHLTPTATTTLINGTTVAGMDTTEAHYPDQMTAAVVDSHDCGATTTMMADARGNFGRTLTISTACSSALNAIIMGCRLLEAGMAQSVVAGGSECLSRFHINGFKSLMILDQQACRPFDATRAGLNLGEGAAFVVLERLDDARKRGAEPLAIVAGMGNACDAFHQTATSPTGEGAFRAMSEALNEAQLAPSDIDYVNAHGTGTPNNDATESAALRRLFGDNMPLVSSTKSMTGHTTSASGSIETVISVIAMQEGFVPLNKGWRTPDDECIIPVHGDEPPRIALRHVLCNSFGFGGNDSAIVLSHPSTLEP